MTQRTWKDGYVPGKAKKTIHLDDEVALALEIRAAEERVSQAEIVERALRKELGMVIKSALGEEYTGYTISYTILGGNLLSQRGDDQGTYDEIESARSYARMVREKLEDEYPGATIEIDLQERTSGAGGGVVVTTPDGGDYRPGDYGEGGSLADEVRELTNRVWESWEWVVRIEAQYAADVAELK